MPTPDLAVSSGLAAPPLEREPACPISFKSCGIESGQHEQYRQSRRALMLSTAGIFISCIFALVYEGRLFWASGSSDVGYAVNFAAGALTSAAAFHRAFRGHPKQAMVMMGLLLIILCLHTTINMGLGLRAPIMVLLCALILGTNFTLGRKPARLMLWSAFALACSLFVLEESGWIRGMSHERHPPVINSLMMLLCLYACAYVFSNAFQDRSDRALAELERKNIALGQALEDKDTALAEREKALEAKARAQTAKDRFLATMSHEIRTPMAGIRTAITLLQNPKTSEAARARYIGALDTTTESLLRLLNDLLDTAQLEAGALNIQSREVALDALVADSVALFELSARQKQLELMYEVDCQPGHAVMADPSRLRQMLANLMGNAIKFTESGRIHVEVRRHDERTDPYVWSFRVTDTGPGISPENQQRLFKPFSQLDNNDNARHGGSGLGLSIVQKLASAMDGECGVISTPGEGSTFWFTARLPDARQDSHAVPA